MQDSHQPPLQTSKVRPWLRGLAWVLPGICAPGFLLAAFAFGYGGSSPPWLDLALLVTLIVLILGCAVFDSLLRLPPRPSKASSPLKWHASNMLLYCLLQVPLIPLIGVITATGCSAVISI